MKRLHEQDPKNASKRQKLLEKKISLEKALAEVNQALSENETVDALKPEDVKRSIQQLVDQKHEFKEIISQCDKQISAAYQYAIDREEPAQPHCTSETNTIVRYKAKLFQLKEQYESLQGEYPDEHKQVISENPHLLWSDSSASLSLNSQSSSNTLGASQVIANNSQSL